jgi:hypothetical protein
MVDVKGQAGDGASAQSGAVLCCGDERGINDRGRWVPDGLTREQIMVVKTILEDEFDQSEYMARLFARQILLALRKLNDAQQRTQTP